MNDLIIILRPRQIINLLIYKAAFTLPYLERITDNKKTKIPYKASTNNKRSKNASIITCANISFSYLIRNKERNRIEKNCLWKS